VIGVTPFLGTFEINVKTSSLWGCSMCAPFWTTGYEMWRLLHKSILERLHDHLFINIISNLPFDSHQTRLRLCVKPSANA
jgi:hypothetical protein